MKNSAFFPVSLGLMAMATSLAPASPMSLPSVVRVSIASDCNGVACRSMKRTRPSTPAADWTTRMFVRRDCLEPSEGGAYFDDLAAHRSPPHMRGKLSPGEDCGTADDDDAEDSPNNLAI